MKVKLDKTKCYGCGSCVAMMSEAFEADMSDGLTKVSEAFYDKDITDTELIKKLQEAVAACPNGAISLE